MAQAKAAAGDRKLMVHGAYTAQRALELHAWLWKHNPRGMFDDWNPNVTCNAA